MQKMQNRADDVGYSAKSWLKNKLQAFFDMLKKNLNIPKTDVMGKLCPSVTINAIKNTGRVAEMKTTKRKI